jgi:hypothetical protein
MTADERGGAVERVVKIPLAVLVVVATAAACGSSARDPEVGSTPDAASSVTPPGTPMGAPSATSSGSSAPPVDTASTDASAADASTTPLAACPSDYAKLNDFLNSTGCGQCASTKCASLTADCFNDCTCIAGALAVFACTVISTDIAQCTTLVTEIPPQYQNETYVCAMTCGHLCESAAGGPLDAGSSDPVTDSGADSAVDSSADSGG